MTSEKPNEVLGLRKYIETYFSGCQAAFAESCGKNPKHIWRQLQSCDYLVVNGNVVQIKYSINVVNAEKSRK